MEIFQKLGLEIEDAWRAANYDEAGFPALAADSLKRAEVPTRTDPWAAAQWALRQGELPRQRDVPSRFGDPALTVFSAPRFHIDLLFWFEGTTSIHQHAFCGAFQVMLGSSIHSWYDFDRELSINKFTEIGSMTLRKCELLSVGDVQEIMSGRQYIHSLFHLDQPSVTIVVRTDRSPLDLPQYNYFKPSLAIDPFFEQETVTKKTQVAAALIRARNPEADRMIAEWLESCDLQTAFGLLLNLRGLLRPDSVQQMFNLKAPGDRFSRFLDIAEKRHGRVGDVFRKVFDEMNALDTIVSRRSYVSDPEHRFFLALLLNVEGRERIFSLIRQRFPDSDPIEKVLDWTEELVDTRLAGDEHTNALGIADFGDIDIFVLEQILRGSTGSAIAEAFRSQYGENAAEAARSIPEKERRIRDAVLLRALLN